MIVPNSPVRANLDDRLKMCRTPNPASKLVPDSLEIVTWTIKTLAI